MSNYTIKQAHRIELSRKQIKEALAKHLEKIAKIPEGVELVVYNGYVHKGEETAFGYLSWIEEVKS